MKVVNIKSNLANIITSSSLWHLGKDSHNALSELVETLNDFINKHNLLDKNPQCKNRRVG